MDGGIEIFIKHLLQCGQQNIHTPFTLCEEIVGKLAEYTTLEGKEIAVLFNLEFLHVLVRKYNVLPRNITIFVDDKREFEFCKYQYGMIPGVNLFYLDMGKTTTEEGIYTLEGKVMKQFDVTVMNPPYQAKSKDSKTKTQPIWDKFVKKATSICKENGFIAAVHPSGWRSCGKIFADGQILKQKQIEYLEIHDESDGLKTFGATTRYDWYVAKNCPVAHSSVVVGQDGKSANVDLRKVSFVPNAMIDKVLSFLAKDGEEKVEILHSFSDYESRKPHVSETKSDKFKFPIVYSTPVAGPTIWYSSTNKNGHFGVPKVILNPSRPIGFVVDKKGEYGMSQFCVGIVGDAAYLEMVANVIKNQKTNGFSDFMEACHFTDKIFNKDVVSLFRKDFWKEFV